MKIKVRFFAYFRDVFGAREKEFMLRSGQTLADLLNQLIETPHQRRELFQNGQLKPQVVVMVNSSVIAADHLSESRLEDGAVVAIFPVMGGG